MRFRPFLRAFATLSSALLFLLPAWGQTPDSDIHDILTDLLSDLKISHAAALQSDSLLLDTKSRREQLADMVKEADEVTLMLYTQAQEFAFDMAFALEKVSDVYESFKEKARLSDKYLIASRSGYRRYFLLGETLEEMDSNHAVPDSVMMADSLLVDIPFVPLEEENPERKALLDSCLYYTHALTALYGSSVAVALQDSVYFADTERRLRQAYDFVRANYAEKQHDLFMSGNVDIVYIFKNWKSYKERVDSDLRLRFGTSPEEGEGGDSNAKDLHPWGGTNSLRHAALALLALLASFLLAGLVTRLIGRWVRQERYREMRPILSAILAVVFFVAGLLLLRDDNGSPYWRMAYRMLSAFFWLILAIFVSLLIRVPAARARASRNIYLPTLLLAFLIILLRAIFLPASIVPLLLAPALLVFIAWQSAVNVRNRAKVDRTDLRYMWASVVIMAVTCILSLLGYSMIGVFLLTFWTFQLALLHTITTLYYLIKRYYDIRVIRRKARYHEENPNLPVDAPNAFIEVTWIYDLLRMVIVPIAILLSVLASFQLTTRAYQLSLTGADFLRSPFFRDVDFQKLTLFNLLLVIALFFIFRYLIYLAKAAIRLVKLRGAIEKKGEGAMPLKESDVNLSLSNALLSLLGWLAYLIVVFSIMDISTKALTTIATGLAAGVGFALKDLINNFFYGVQLMAGRIRVGDKIACDGVRGIVKRISYQTTQVEDEDGSLIAFTNTDLFTKQFRNLNSGRNYELLKMPVCVKYGTDVAQARDVILEALKPLMTKDKYGRDVVDPSFPVDVRFDGFGDSSVNLIVALYSTVETHYTFPARALEAIYNAFYEHGIEIPFPQRDVYVKSVPEK